MERTSLPVYYSFPLQTQIEVIPTIAISPKEEKLWQAQINWWMRHEKDEVSEGPLQASGAQQSKRVGSLHHQPLQKVQQV